MSWRNVIDFSFLLLFFNVLVLTVANQLLGVPEVYSLSRFWGEKFAIGLSSFIVFVVLARKGLSRPYLNAFGVLVLASVASHIIVSALLGRLEYGARNAAEAVFSVSALLLGTYFGLALNDSKFDANT